MTVKDNDSDLKLIRSLIKKGYQPLVVWIQKNSDQWQQANETAHLHITSRMPKDEPAEDERKQALALAISVAPRTPNNSVPTDVGQTLTAVVNASADALPEAKPEQANGIAHINIAARILLHPTGVYPNSLPDPGNLKQDDT
jgi:hypothetical protein